MKKKGCATALFFILLFPTFAKEPRVIEYLYIDSNTGQSSGGHTAIKVGSLVYHFQHYPDKIFRIVRESWNEFRFIYGVIDNRTIRSSKIEVSDHTYNLVRDNLNKIYLIQNKHLTNYSNFFNDRVLLEAFKDKENLIKLRGAGYFSEYKKNNPDLAILSKLIEEKHGQGFVNRKIDEARKKIRYFKIFINPLKNRTENPRKDEFPFSDETFSENHINTIHFNEAFHILKEGNDLKPQSYFMSEEPKTLSDTQREKFISYSKEIESQITDLVNSHRKGAGYSLLVAIARYMVVKKSIQESKLYFLDCFGSRHVLVSRKAIQDSVSAFPLQKESFAFYKIMLEKIFQKDNFDEFDYGLLEDSANRHAEMNKGIYGFEPIRTTYERLLPYKEKEIQFEMPAGYSENEIEVLLQLAKEKEELYLRKLQKIYDYNLFSRNCVTEIFDTLNSFFEHGKIESKFRLGGYIDGKDSFVFVPFYSSHAVNRKYKIHKIEDFYSYRRSKLKEMKITENNIKVFLRESNIFTSSFYKRNPDDSFFIFVTDDNILPRPIFGLVNFAAGVAETLYGIIMLPFDKGDHFLKGVQGMFFSLPEIFFFNIRKGTFTYIDRSDLPKNFLEEEAK